MIDTVKIEMLLKSDAPDNNEIAEMIEGMGYTLKHSRGSTHFGGSDIYFPASGGVLLPTGMISITRSRKCYAEIALGNVTNYHNAYLLSFDEADCALREYLRMLGENLPFVDVTSARATRVDVYWQWRIIGPVDWSILPFFLGDFGPCARFEVRGNGTSAFIKRTKKHCVRLYNKSSKVSGDMRGLDEVIKRMPDGIIRLEVELHSNAGEAYRNPLAPRKRKTNKLSTSLLRKSGILVSNTCRIPIDGSAIFDRANIVEALKHEWPSVYCAPISNADDLICNASIWTSTALVLHDNPMLRQNYFDNKTSNRANAVKSIRNVELQGPPDSLMHIPDLGEIEFDFEGRSSRYYIREVHWHSSPSRCTERADTAHNTAENCQ